MTGGLFDDLVTNANNSNSGSNVQNYEEPDTMSSGGLFSDLVPPQKGSPKTSPVQNLQDRSFFDNFFGKFNSSVADVAGFPFDTFPETLGKAASKLTGEETPKGSYGSDWVKNKFNEIGIDTSYAPNSYGAAASNNMLAAAAAVPVGRVMKGLKYLGPATNLVRKIGSALSDSPVTNIVSSIPMSMGGHLASNSAPDEYKPLADFAGQLATGAGLSAIGSGAEVGLSALIKAYKSARPSKIDVAGVKVSKDRAAAVGKDILSSASNPEYVRQQLGLTDTAPAQPFVYGSKPTLAETMVDPTQEGNVGDVGISNWERNLAQQSTGKGKFLARLNQQHNAQLEQINEVGGEGGGVDLSNLFKQKRETLEDQTNKEIQDLLSNAQKSSSSLGGEYPPDLRANLQSAINAHNAKEDTLWNPFYDTYKDSPIPVLKNKQSVQKQIDSISSKGGQKLNEEESRLYGIMNGVKGVKGVKSDSWSDTEPFSVIKNMITSVHNAQMKLRTDDDYQSMQAFNRLKEVKSSLYDSLDNAVKNIGDYEAQKVKNGLMPQENTIYNLLSKDKEDILANQERISSRGDSQGIAPGYEQGTTNVLSGGGGTEIPSSGEFSGSTGSKGLPENASQPVKYDQQAQDQYKAARAHTLEQKNLFTKGPVGEILKPGPSGQRYLMADGSVNPSIFNRTPKSPGAIKQYMMALKASGFPEEKTALDLQDAAVNQMRHPSRGIVNDEGTINPDKLQRFIDQHASAIDAVPGLRDKLANAKQAQQTYFDSVQRQAQSKKEFEDSQAARMIGKHPVDAMKDVFSGTDRNEIKQRIQALKNDIGDNSEANKSLKRNMTDFILEKVMGKSIDDVASINTKNPKAFRDFLTNNKQALSLVYSPEEMSSLKAVALDSYRKAVVGKTSLISGQSNSAADLHAMMSENGSTHPHEIINDHALNFLIGSSAHAHPVAAGATIGAKFLNKIRNAFLENDIKDEKTLKTVAALHPEIARLFVQISDNYNPTAIKKFAVQLHKIAVESLIGTLSDPKEAQ